MQSFTDGRKVKWVVGEREFATIQEAKVHADETNQPIRRMFTD